MNPRNVSVIRSIIIVLIKAKVRYSKKIAFTFLGVLATALLFATNLEIPRVSSSKLADAAPFTGVSSDIAGNVATLNSLVLTGAYLGTAFASNVSNYTANAYIATLGITAHATDATAKIKINGITLPQGDSTHLILTQGTTTVVVSVTSSDGTVTNTYTLTVNYPPATDATLSYINMSGNSDNISAIAPTPAFTSANTTYVATAYGPWVDLTPTANNNSATITVNGTPVISNSAFHIPLNAGQNLITIVVTAVDGVAKKTYSITVNRVISNDATLYSLNVSYDVSLSPAFTPGNSSYTATTYSSSIAIVPGTNNRFATFTVNGAAARSDGYSLNVGQNVFAIAVVAQDGVTIKIYTITVTRLTSNDATLSGLSVVNAVLSPVFNSSVTTYSSTTNANSVTITPVINESHASITILGTAVASGSSHTFQLALGLNTIPVIVTALDGSLRTYTLNITYALSNDATLSNLSLTDGFYRPVQLTPVFSPSTNSYNFTVITSNYYPTVYYILPQLSNSYGRIKINGALVNAGQYYSAPITLGLNSFSIVVTAQDGITTRTFTVNINYVLSSDAALSGLSTSVGQLTPAFQPGVSSYKIICGAGSDLSITPTPHDPGAAVAVNGQTVSSGSYFLYRSLSVGQTTFSIVVTAPDGVTHQTYTIVAIVPANNDASLFDITIDHGASLTPVFSPSTGTYNATIYAANFTITATPTNGRSVIAINGSSNLSGNGYYYYYNAKSTPGQNIFNIVVTAPDGSSTQTYTLNVNQLSPTLSYNSPQIFTAGSPVTPQIPTSSGVAPYAFNFTIAYTGLYYTPISGMAADAAGNLYVAEQNTVKMIPANGGTPVVIASGFGTPSALAVDGQGNIFVADSWNNAIKEILANTWIVKTISWAAYNPTAIAVDPSGNIFYKSALYQYNEVFEIPVINRSIYYDNFITGSASINGLATDAAGNLYITDGGDNSIKKISPGNSVVQTYATGIAGPFGIAVDNTGNIFITCNNGSIKMIPAGSSQTQTLPSSFSSATGIATDVQGDVFLFQGNYIFKMNPTGGFFLNKPLPTGLVFDNKTGTISGTPTQPSPATIYTATAYNFGASVSASFTLQAELPSPANLTNLSLSSGTLAPVFSAGTTSYTDTVSNATTSVTITPTSADPNASIKVKGVAVNSGTATPSLPLIVGNNTITTVVTAQDGVTTKTYTVNVTRLSNNANLAGLSLSSGSLSPAFASSTQAYTASVSNATASINITPTVSDPTATIKVNGVLTNSGAASANIPLALSAPTSIKIVVTAQNGTVKTYQVMVTRLSNNANLTNLTLSKGVLSPAFATPTQNYTASVTNATTSISITPTTSSAVATVKVNGIAVVSGTASAAIPLVVGTNVVRAQVTAQDGTVKTYTLTISRALSSNANLAGITLSNGTLSPAFNTTTQVYGASVSNATASITLTAITSDVTATIKVNGASVVSGTASAGIPLALSAPTGIHVVVTAQDGTVKTYTVNVTRLSNNANLSNLTLNNGTLTPSFTVSNQNYTASVDNTITSVSLTPTTSSALATVTVNGLTTTSGTASAAISMNVGANVIHVAVAAQDGTLKTYTVTVTRAMGSLNSIYTPGANGGTTPLIASLNNEQVIANNILSPNGDGVNDIWVVKNIAFYPNNRVSVFDQSGRVVFTAKNYANDWAGTYRGSVLTEGTYYYLIDLGNSV